jgi:hypothetical protein
MACAGGIAGRVATMIAVAIVWIVVFWINAWCFKAITYSSYANWVFLPAAVRLIVVLLCQKVGALGLVLGAYATMSGTSSGHMLHQMLVAATSGLAPLVAVWAGKRWFLIPDSLAGLRAMHIALLSTLCSVCNAVLLNTYLLISRHLDHALAQIATVFVGDFLGTAIVLFLLSFGLSFAIPRSHRP